ncbi:MAG: metallopeptidase TldD-related protein, partial [Burkholderiaceae bacterium]
MSDFFTNSDISQQQTEQLVSETLSKCDDGELFLENSRSESLLLDDGKIKNTSFDTSLGFGFRAVHEDKTAFCHSNIISKKSLEDASQNLKSNIKTKSQNIGKQNNPKRTNVKLYDDKDPIENKLFGEKVELLKKIDHYIRQKNPNIKQVTASFFGEHQSIEIIKSDSQIYKDQRPLVRFNVSVMMEKNGKKETGSFGTGGRKDYESYLGNDNWKIICDEAIRQAEVNLDSKPAPAGEMKVVLGPGWPGIILHEAIGHGLEGDFNRKKTSAFHNLVGQKIANENVTIVDDGTIASRRGSLTIDD